VAEPEVFSFSIAGYQVKCLELDLNEGKDRPIKVEVQSADDSGDAPQIVRLIRKLVMEDRRGYFMEELNYVLFSDAPSSGVLNHREKSDVTVEDILLVLKQLTLEMPDALPSNQLRLQITRIMNEGCTRVPASL
jgi:hypothetical protein